ncbi:hypothetical protein N665_0472s0014 [Sinapis alba]|nr:hypothetical protein N665_4150s0005 [Sinapis alba]KAF8090581.1 hypothetical protein N665_0472s0014 [Sinapis alba]
MKLLKDSKMKAGNGFVMVDNWTWNPATSRLSYLTVEFLRKLHLEPKQEKPNPRNAPSQNAIYSDNHFRKIGSNVSVYVNMLCDSLRISLPKTVVLLPS